MSYAATVYQVIIASPSDVAQERRIARDVILEWNDMHSRRNGIVLMPVTWETHSAPAMGDRPQAIINKQILSDSDLLIGIFWTKLGTPTGEAASGTVEEIKKHLSAGKPAMLYFSSAPVRLDSVDQKQYENLKQFQGECKGQGLVATYEDIPDFQGKLAAHLTKTVLDNDYFKKQSEREQFPGGAVVDDTPGIYGDPKRPHLWAQERPLSKEAILILSEAVNDKNGTVALIRTRGGNAVHTNGKYVVETSDARIAAMWEGALAELCNKGFLADQGGRGEVFRITRLGYEMADHLRAFG